MTCPGRGLGGRAPGEGRAPAAVAIAAVIVVAGLAAASWSIRPSAGCPQTSPGPPPARSPIQHLFLIIKENHAYENYFGDLPGSVGFPPNGTFPANFGAAPSVHPFPLGFRSPLDLPHDRAADLSDLDGGRNDQFVAQAAADGYPQPQDAVGYYNATEIPDYYAYAKHYRLADRFFSGVLGPTLPNRLFDLGLTNSTWSSDAIPPGSTVAGTTLLGQLENAGVTWDYLHSGPGTEVVPLLVPQIANDACLASRVLPFSDLPSLLSSPSPPNVTYIDTSNDPVYGEHPPGNVTLGEEWTVAVVDAIFRSPIGAHSAVLLYYDENGGFWDPVAPPQIGPQGDGFRVPLLIISPWSTGGHLIHETLDAASILGFIDDNWGLPPLNSRIAAAPSLETAFDFAASPSPPLLLSTPIDPWKVSFPGVPSTPSPPQAPGAAAAPLARAFGPVAPSALRPELEDPVERGLRRQTKKREAARAGDRAPLVRARRRPPSRALGLREAHDDRPVRPGSYASRPGRWGPGSMEKVVEGVGSTRPGLPLSST
jgi:phospholipase C